MAETWRLVWLDAVPASSWASYIPHLFLRNWRWGDIAIECDQKQITYYPYRVIWYQCGRRMKQLRQIKRHINLCGQGVSGVSMAILRRTVSLGSVAKVKKKKGSMFTLQFPPFSPKATVGSPLFTLGLSKMSFGSNISWGENFYLSVYLTVYLRLSSPSISLSLWPHETE